MSKGEFKFFSVGQGLFHAGKIHISDNKYFSFIYDCGTKKTSILPQSIDSCLNFFKDLSCSDKVSQIDFLFISHLHADHINGLKLLIQELRKSKITIKNIILPYVNVYQRIILLLEALKTNGKSTSSLTIFNTDFSEQDYIDFYKNPYKYLQEQFKNLDLYPDNLPVFYIVNSPVNYYISDKKSDSEFSALNNDVTREYFQSSSKKAIDYFKKNHEANYFFDKNSSLCSEEHLGLDYHFFDEFAQNKNDDISNIHNDFFLISDSLGIFVNDTWRFSCFNTPLPSSNKKYIIALHREYQNILKSTGNKGSIEVLFSRTNIRLLQKHYKSISSDLNATSLLIYHFPTSANFNFLRNEASFLLLGDINLNCVISNKINNIKNSFLDFLSSRVSFLQFNNKRLSSANFVLAPHHGSDLSWNINIFNLLKEPSFYIVSSSLESKKHPGIEFMKSFHSLDYFTMPKNMYLDPWYLFLPSSIARYSYLHRIKNCLLWCNEKQGLEIIINDSENYVQIDPSQII